MTDQETADWHTQAGLDAAMRSVLARLELVSHGTTQSWNAAGGSPSTVTRPGQGHPEGTPTGGSSAPHIEWRRRYHAQDTNEGRASVIRGAKEELKLWTGRYTLWTEGAQGAEETPDETIARMLTETEGWTPEEVERSRWRMAPRLVRRHRILDSRDPATGKPTKLTAPAEDAEPAARARELDAQGLSLRQIGMLLGKDQKQIQRYLKRAA